LFAFNTLIFNKVIFLYSCNRYKMDDKNKLIVFQEKHIRRVWYKEEWWFSVSDVVEVLTDTADIRQYIKKMRKRDDALNSNWGTICTPVQLVAKDGKKRKVNCANTEGIFRIIQSIPSPKAEPFKQWLAKVGYERIQEIENPELAAERARQYYRDLGYDDSWIENRMQSIEIRGKLTDEWKNRGVKEGLEYAILTAEIAKASFGMTPSEYKKFKGLNRENLRDHMTDLELIFTMLGETQTRIEAINKDAQGLRENKEAAQKGGKAAGKALDAFEKETQQKVVRDTNFLNQIEEAKKQKKLEDKRQND
jgi:DNA-damage-inducible protein D